VSFVNEAPSQKYGADMFCQCWLFENLKWFQHQNFEKKGLNSLHLEAK
jgi:hypothetical protein